MDRTAVFVDAGYLFAAGSNLVVHERLARGELHLDHAGILRLLEQIVQEVSGLPLLRVYWYDGTSGVPTPQQLALAYQPGVKLRLGFVNQHGQQRGVDSLIITDLIHLSRNRAMADAVLLTGDEDLRVGVQQAQELGVRVHLVGIAPVRENQSSLLRQEADTLLELSREQVQAFLKPVSESSRPGPAAPPAASPAGPGNGAKPAPSGGSPATANGGGSPAAANGGGSPAAPAGPAASSPTAPPTPPANGGASAAAAPALPPAPPPQVDLLGVAQRIAEGLTFEEIEAVLQESSGGSVPSSLDRRLLIEGSRACGKALTPELKRLVRTTFLAACRNKATK